MALGAMTSVLRSHRAQTALAATLAGLGLRLYILATGLSATDSDESVIGLIGLHASRGTFDAMFWGQHYGGTIEALLVAPLFKVFGPSVLVERLLLFVIAAVAALLTWRIGRRLVGEPAATIAGALFWTTSCYFVWWSTKINIYCGALCLALAVVLLLLRLRDEGDGVPRWWPVAFGLAAGAAIWSNPQTVFLLVPAALVHVRPLLRHLKQVALAIPFAIVGAAPWLIYSVRNDWKTLKVPGVDVYLPYTERVLLFFRQLPIALGARQPMNDRWIVPAAVFAVVAVVLAVAVVVAAIRNVRGVRVIGAVVLGYALLYGTSPQGGQPGASLQPRYLLFVTPFLALGLAAVFARRYAAAGVGMLVVTVALSAIGLHAMESNRTTLLSAAPGVSIPTDIDDLTSLLRDRDIHRAYSFYWVAYRTTFETDEDVIVDPAHWHVSRYRPYADAVRNSPKPPAVIVFPGGQVAAMVHLFEAKGIAYQVHQRGTWIVVEPAAKVDREEIAAAFRSVGILA